ncbi:23S rRNA (guanine(745)-N(1))-methyltransferase [Clostridia bacterium]|nr:23S rRNA (guanine(745)-N(1))-methyltransferase [Clostridia bacterium]
MFWLCPVCLAKASAERPLTAVGGALSCPLGHGFDVAREGYVNLAGSVGRAGDDADMCRCRQAFLAGGHYAPFAKALAQLILSALPNTRAVPRVLDAGCGEGYYLRALKAETGTPLCLAGADLSKEAVKRAAKADGGIAFAVANVCALPVASGSLDAALSVFAPIVAAETARVLRPDGVLAVAAPGEGHLFEFKQALYENPTRNPEKQPILPGFDLLHSEEISINLCLTGQEIWQLFGMTPYRWKSPPEAAERAKSLKTLDTEASFILRLFRKTHA